MYVCDAVLDSAVAARTLTLNPVAACEVICANARTHADIHTHICAWVKYSKLVCVCVIRKSFFSAKKKVVFSGFASSATVT